MIKAVRSYRFSIAVVALVAAFALVLLLAVPNPSQATTRTGHEFIYYSDATHSTVVGYRYYCVGYSGGWGTITPYYEINPFPCN